MSSDPEVASLTAMVARMQRELRELATGNPLNRGSVQHANGGYVSLSSIAFGQVTYESPNDGQSATLTQAQDVSGFGTGFRDIGPPVTLDVLVTGGALRVDISTSIFLRMNSGTDPLSEINGTMSYALLGPVESQELLNPGSPVAVPPDSFSAVSVSCAAPAPRIQLTAGNFATHAGLRPGWYRIAARYSLTYAASAKASAFADFYGQRLAATPL